MKLCTDKLQGFSTTIAMDQTRHALQLCGKLVSDSKKWTLQLHRIRMMYILTGNFSLVLSIILISILSYKCNVMQPDIYIAPPIERALRSARTTNTLDEK